MQGDSQPGLMTLMNGRVQWENIGLTCVNRNEVLHHKLTLDPLVECMS